MADGRQLSSHDILIKAEKYCAYQDRSEREVRDRLKRWDCEGADADEIIDNLIESGFLDDERFAESYVRGKFRMKKWGRVKIRAGLIKKGVSETLINSALQSIDDAEYSTVCRAILDKFMTKHEGLDEWEFRGKATRHLASKGFEMPVIIESLDALNSKNRE